MPDVTVPGVTLNGGRKPIDLDDRLLLGLVLGVVFCLVAYVFVLPALPPAWQRPGSPPLYLTGVAAAALLLVSMVFVVVKRSGRGGSPVTWFAAHVVAACVGSVLTIVHSVGSLGRAPALLILTVFALAVLGIWARVRLSRRMAATFGAKRGGFAAPDEAAKERLGRIIAEKTAVLGRLDAEAREATFSVTLAHWLGRPVLAWTYARLVREENRLIGARASVGTAQAFWRPLHMALAYLFVAGVVIHVVTVTFFAGYVADGGPITWWHLAAW
jgi:hypothetical protein